MVMSRFFKGFFVIFVLFFYLSCSLGGKGSGGGGSDVPPPEEEISKPVVFGPEDFLRGFERVNETFFALIELMGEEVEIKATSAEQIFGVQGGLSMYPDLTFDAFADFRNFFTEVGGERDRYLSGRSFFHNGLISLAEDELLDIAPLVEAYNVIKAMDMASLNPGPFPGFMPNLGGMMREKSAHDTGGELFQDVFDGYLASFQTGKALYLEALASYRAVVEELFPSIVPEGSVQ